MRMEGLVSRMGLYLHQAHLKYHLYVHTIINYIFIYIYIYIFWFKSEIPLLLKEMRESPSPD